MKASTTIRSSSPRIWTLSFRARLLFSFGEKNECCSCPEFPIAVHALATAIHLFAATAAGRRAGTSFNVGVIRGGISVNAIPTEAFMEVDVRSVNPSSLDDLDVLLHRAVTEATRTVDVACKVEMM